MTHSLEDVQRIRNQCKAILERDCPRDPAQRNAEASWRMRAIIHWWVEQMFYATHGDVELIVRALYLSMKDAGIESQVMPVMASQTPQ